MLTPQIWGEKALKPSKCCVNKSGYYRLLLEQMKVIPLGTFSGFVMLKPQCDNVLNSMQVQPHFMGNYTLLKNK